MPTVRTSRPPSASHSARPIASTDTLMECVVVYSSNVPELEQREHQLLVAVHRDREATDHRLRLVHLKLLSGL